MLDNQRRLSTLEPRPDVSMLLLALVAPSGRLAVPGGGTATDSLAFFVRALVGRQAAED